MKTSFLARATLCFLATAAFCLGLGAHPAQAAKSKIGGNLWFRIDWGELGDHKVWKRGANFATDANPFDQTFLDEISPYSTLRFMEWDSTNFSTEQDWAKRRQKSEFPQESLFGDRDNYNKVVAGTGGIPTKGVAYEWQITLCNLKHANYWVNIPHRANDEYIRNLAALIHKNLDPHLTVYVEYSNEVWFGQSQSEYATAQGAALHIADQLGNVDAGISDDTKNQQGFYVTRALQAFKIFKDEFGSKQGRVKGVLAGLVGDNWNCQVWKAALDNPKLNPNKLWPDYVATSYYPGQSIDGAAPDALQQLYDDEVKYFYLVKQAKSNATSVFKVPMLMYEGGYSVFKNADVLAKNPKLYDWQQKYLDDMVPYFDLMVLYCHTTPWSSSQAYGFKSYIGQPNADAPRYRALLDWIKEQH